MFWLIAFLLLGIERVLYGFIYQYPNCFKRTCRGPLLKDLWEYNRKVYWQVALHLGVVIKVFQFSVIGYDILVFRSTGLEIAPLAQLCAGAALMGLGQLLSMAVYSSIGGIGVYYGSQLGYEVPWCNAFPYNMGLPDPQYWGVVICIWGAYLCLTPSLNVFSAPYAVPWMELFWYLTSMKLLESSKNWQVAVEMLGLPPDLPPE